MSTPRSDESDDGSSVLGHGPLEKFLVEHLHGGVLREEARLDLLGQEREKECQRKEHLVLSTFRFVVVVKRVKVVASRSLKPL